MNAWIFFSGKYRRRTAVPEYPQENARINAAFVPQAEIRIFRPGRGFFRGIRYKNILHL